ncbi:MAG TPA: BCCT family transporter [Coxiellaceae bacterium]|nr:BCCT family transporter [Coxiellaceae bacterium]
MHQVKPNLFLQLVFVPSCLIVDFILARYYPAQTLQLYVLHWACLILLLIFCFFPFAHKRLATSAEEKPRFKLWQWLSLVWIFELSVVAIFAGLVQLIDLIQSDLNLETALLNSSWIEHWGLFPWAMMVSLACLSAYYAYLKKKDADISAFMFPLFRSERSEVFGITANMCARLNMVLVLVGSLMIASLSLAWLITHYMHLPLISGLNIETILILSLMLIVVGHRKLSIRLFETLMKRKVSVFSILILAMVLIAGLLVLSSWILSSTETHAVSLPHWLTEDAPLDAIIQLFLVVWAIAWCSLGSVFMAYVSRGYTLFQLIVAALILPISGWLLKEYLSFPSPQLILFLALIAILILFYLFMKNSNTIGMVMQVHVAADDQVKQRAYQRFVINWIRMSMGLIYLYLPGGILLLGLFLIMYTLPIFVYLLVAILISGIWLLLQRKAR